MTKKEIDKYTAYQKVFENKNIRNFYIKNISNSLRGWTLSAIMLWIVSFCLLGFFIKHLVKDVVDQTSITVFTLAFSIFFILSIVYTYFITWRFLIIRLLNKWENLEHNEISQKLNKIIKYGWYLYPRNLLAILKMELENEESLKKDINKLL